ncbi:flavodoxin [Roseburia sp. CAG:197]|nr:flavodoxin [Roseburia sp. CAG:197]
MKSKRLLSIILAGVTAIGLMSGCGSTNQNSSSSNNDNKNANNTAESDSNVADDTTAAASNGKTLVVYYSATGNTKNVAETIAQVTGGDLFEIEPKEPYTDDDLDWTNDDSRVSREHEDESSRDVELTSTEVPDWDSYDTVYIGYPIWWGIAAWPVDSFVKANDFTGKTVVTFCTAASSGIGQSGDLLEEMAGTGNWISGERFRSGATEDDIRAWIDGLGL